MAGLVFQPPVAFANFGFEKIKAGEKNFSQPLFFTVDVKNNIVYVADTGDDSIVVLDGIKREAFGKIKIGAKIAALAVDSANNRLYVADSYGRKIYIIDSAKIAQKDFSQPPILSRVEMGVFQPSRIRIIVDLGQAFVLGSSATTSAIFSLDLAGNEPPKTLQLPQGFIAGKRNQMTAVRGAKKLYLTTPENDSVLVIDAQEMTLAKVITLERGARPIDLASDDALGKVYVLENGASKVAVINIQKDEVESLVDVIRSPLAISVNDFDHKVYAVGGLDSAISVLSAKSGKTVAETVNLPGSGGFSTVLAPSLRLSGEGEDILKDKVFIAGVNALTVIESSSGKVIKNIQLSFQPSRLFVNLVNADIYVSGEGAVVAVVDGRTLEVAKTIPEKPGVALAAGQIFSAPGPLALTPDGKKLYVANTDSGSVTVFDIEKNSVLKLIKSVGQGIADLAVQGQLVFSVNSGESSATVIDAKEDKIKEKINLGSGPHKIFSEPGQSRIFVLTDAGLVVLDGSSGRKINSAPINKKANDLAVDFAAKRIFISSAVDENILILDSETYQKVGEISSLKSVGALALSREKKVIFALQGRVENRVKVFNYDGSLLKTIALQYGPDGMMYDKLPGGFTDDGGVPSAIALDDKIKKFYVSTEDGVVSIYNLDTLEHIKTLTAVEPSASKDTKKISLFLDAASDVVYAAFPGGVALIDGLKDEFKQQMDFKRTRFFADWAVDTASSKIYLSVPYKNTVTVVNAAEKTVSEINGALLYGAEAQEPAPTSSSARAKIILIAALLVLAGVAAAAAYRLRKKSAVSP